MHASRQDRALRREWYYRDRAGHAGYLSGVLYPGCGVRWMARREHRARLQAGKRENLPTEFVALLRRTRLKTIDPASDIRVRRCLGTSADHVPRAISCRRYRIAAASK